VPIRAIAVATGRAGRSFKFDHENERIVMFLAKIVCSATVILGMPIAILSGNIQTRAWGLSLATSGIVGIFLSQCMFGKAAFLTFSSDNSLGITRSRSMIACEQNQLQSTSQIGHSNEAQAKTKLSRAEKRAAKQSKPADPNWQRTKANALQRRELFPLQDYSGCDGYGNLPQREIICADALGWLEEQEMLPGSVFTSMPDLSEIDMIVRTDKSLTKRGGVQ
jgi:hypothetical protein